MNDLIKSAIVLTTCDVGGDAIPLEIASILKYNHDHPQDMVAETPAQLAYYADVGCPYSLSDNDPDHFREHLIEALDHDNASWFNARSDGEIFSHKYVFPYTRVYSLYQFSENLEGWCKSVETQVRTSNGSYLYDASGQMMSNVEAAKFVFRCYLAPDYTFRIICSTPQFVGCWFHKAFRTIYKLPRWLDFEIREQNPMQRENPGKFGYGEMPGPPDLGAVQVIGNQQDVDNIVALCTPFVPLYGFQDCFHRVRGYTLTSDLPTCGEISLNNGAYYRILTDFHFVASTGVIESSASKKNYLSTDSNFLSEAPPGQLIYYSANGTHGRIILLRGSQPLYNLLVQVMGNVTLQNPYEYSAAGYLKYHPEITGPQPALEPVRMAPGTHFECKLAFISKQKMPHIHPNTSE